MFSALTKTSTFVFSQTLFKRGIQTLHHYNLDWGLQFHNRLDNFDLVSKLHMCQKHEMQIVVFRLFHCRISVVWLHHAQCALLQSGHGVHADALWLSFEHI